jgi:putative nucleotidyltransferase with HDIG domain
MDIDEARELVWSRVKNKNLRKHILAVAAVMKHLARRLGEDQDKWELCGMLHDLDYEETKDEPERHTLVAEPVLREKGVDEDVIEAVKAHAGKAPLEGNMNIAAYCADPVTGLVVACALIHPDKKLEPIDAEFAMKRFKEKRFAAGADRDRIRACERLGIELEDFLDLAIRAMKDISDDLGL